MASLRTARAAAIPPILAESLVQVKTPDRVNIENFVGYVPVAAGLAGPLKTREYPNPNPDSETEDELYALLATVEPTLVASCSRGCKAFTKCGGINFSVISEGMSRAPYFSFTDPGKAFLFAKGLKDLEPQFSAAAKETSRFVQLQSLTPNVIGSKVHVKFTYSCGDAVGQNMVTIATQVACDRFMQTPLAKEMGVENFCVEGDMASDKKPSWGNVKDPRGVQVMAWGVLTNEVCLEVLRCSSESVYDFIISAKEAQIRNGQFGSNVNTANIIAAMFIACGQDAGSVAEASWSHLTAEYARETGKLTMSLYFPSLPVGVVGGGTHYTAQKSALELLGCGKPGTKNRLAGVIASFALALEISTSAALAHGSFTRSHERLARGQHNKPTET